MVRHVHDTEEEQGDIFPDDGWVRSTTNVTKPSPIVTVTRSEDTSAESVGSRIKDAMLRNNESLSPSIVPPRDVASFNDYIQPNDDEYYKYSDNDDDDDKENDNDLRDQINDGDAAIPPTKLARQRECDNGSERPLSPSPIATSHANGGNARNRRWSAAHHPRYQGARPIRPPSICPPAQRSHSHISRSCPEYPTLPSHRRRRGRIVYVNVAEATASFVIPFRRRRAHRRRSSRSCPVGRTSP